jgi:hypothetical protein
LHHFNPAVKSCEQSFFLLWQLCPRHLIIVFICAQVALRAVIAAAGFMTMKAVSSDGYEVCQTRPAELVMTARTYI